MMAETIAQASGTTRLTGLALTLSIGGLVLALAGGLGNGAGSWGFKVALLMLVIGFLMAIGGGLAAIVAFVLGRRRGVANGRATLVALAVSIVFCGFVGSQIATAMGVPMIHDVTTNLADVPQFTTLTVRADNLADLPDGGDPALAAMNPMARWQAIHRKGYPDLQPVHLALDTAQAMKRATALVQKRGWTIAKVDTPGGKIEATATSLFFRFKDDIVIRVRPDLSPAGGATVDMRSISRVGESDIGVNARRIRDFLRDLQQA